MSKTHVNKFLVASLLLAFLPLLADAQQWNPRPGWKDSYAVGGKCYCDSNGYDHGLDRKSADTPIGIQNVVDICETIERVLGEGPSQGRIPYNDIQCGNGPANDAADETGCPGRVDIGPDGCDQIGPKWDLQTAYANAPDTPQNPDNETPEPDAQGRLDRNNWVLSASHNNRDVDNMVDGSASSRWATGTRQAAGQWVIIDLAVTQSFDRIVLNSDASPNDYPRTYSVFVSSNGRDWGNALINGQGQGSITDIRLATQNSRYIRINQNGSSDRFWWSIHELEIYSAQNTERPSQPPSAPRSVIAWINTIISMLLMGE